VIEKISRNKRTSLTVVGRIDCSDPEEKTQLQKLFQTLQVRRCVHVAAETKIQRAVITQDGAVSRRLTIYRRIGVTTHHLVAEQVERKLWPRHICAHQVEWGNRQLGQNGTG